MSGGLHSIAVSGSGQILTWGANQNGLLGLGSSAQQNVPTPTPVPDVFAAHVRSSPSLGRFCTVCLHLHHVCT
jgi:alpha-tubulin suppressor-like RCC1 family protein